jgi:uncharacterized hydrophobic protein (TIGR00271 family)
VSKAHSAGVYHVQVAVGNLAELAPLLAISCAIAGAHNGKVTILSVTPDGHRPEWLTGFDSRPESPHHKNETELVLPKACDGVPVDVAMRLGHHAGGAILAAVRENPPDLLVLGWRGDPGRGEYLLGSTLDPLIRKSPCDIIVLRVGDDPDRLVDVLSDARHVVVPMAGGPHAALAVDLALDLSPSVQVTALNVAQTSRGRAGIHLGRERLAEAIRPWKDNERVQPKVVQAPGVVGGILNEARSGYDLLLIGASRESYIDRMLFGNVPQTVASESLVPTIVVKRPEKWEENLLRRGWQSFLDGLPSLTVAERVEVYRTVRRGARADADFYVMIGLSATIAALGLLLNSPAVIIGAMLVAPLMSAIVGLGLGVVQGDWRLLRLAAGASARGMTLAIFVGILAGLVGVLTGFVVRDAVPNSEILGRINPTLLDLGIALASGAAGAYALCRRDVSSSLPGVAIAAALVPPLAAAGIGLALWNGRIAGGALLLFLTNLIAISAAGGLVFLLLGFRPELEIQTRARVFAGGVASVAILLLAVTVPLAVLTVNSLHEASFHRTLEGALEQEIAAMGNVEMIEWRIVNEVSEDADHKVEDDNTLSLELSVRAPRQLYHSEVVDLQQQVAIRLQRPVALRLNHIPVTQLDPVVPPTFTPTPTPTSTATPGPTATATRTATPTAAYTSTSTVTPTPTLSATETETPTASVTATEAISPTNTSTSTVMPSMTPTATIEPTPTPVSGVVVGTAGRGVRLRLTPNGATAVVLREGDPVTILYQREFAAELEWIQVRDQEGRVGWVAAPYVQPQP